MKTSAMTLLIGYASMSLLSCDHAKQSPSVSLVAVKRRSPLEGQPKNGVSLQLANIEKFKLPFQHSRSALNLWRFTTIPSTLEQEATSMFEFPSASPTIYLVPRWPARTNALPDHLPDALSLIPLEANQSALIWRMVEPLTEKPIYKQQHNKWETNSQPVLNPPLWRYSLSWTVAFCVAYLVVFFLGLVGNLSVLWVIFILRRRSGRHSMFATCNKVFNGLIGNLALADLLVIIFCLPATLLGNIFTPWILGRFVCKAVQYFQGVSVSASVYTLVAISIDRFYGIYYPFANGFSHIIRRTVIILIWLLSFVIAIPWIFFFDLVDNDHVMMCQEVWPDDFWPNLYFVVVNFGFQYLVPLSIILIFYVLLMMKIWRRKVPMFHSACRRETSTDTVDQWNSRIVEQSKMKVLKMLIVIVSLFALSWLPLYVIFLRLKLGQFEEDSFEGKLVIRVTPLAQWLGASNSCVNPILYFFFNSKFRAYLKKAITRNFLCSSSFENTRNCICNQQQKQQQQTTSQVSNMPQHRTCQKKCLRHSKGQHSLHGIARVQSDSRLQVNQNGILLASFHNAPITADKSRMNSTLVNTVKHFLPVSHYHYQYPQSVSANCSHTDNNNLFDKPNESSNESEDLNNTLKLHQSVEENGIQNTMMHKNKLKNIHTNGCAHKRNDTSNGYCMSANAIVDNGHHHHIDINRLNVLLCKNDYNFYHKNTFLYPNLSRETQV